MNNETYIPKIEKPFLEGQDIKPKKEKRVKEEKYSRRGFFKKLGCLTASAVVSAGGFKALEEILGDSHLDKHEKNKIPETDGNFQEITEYTEYIEEEISSEQEKKEYKTISKIFKLGLDQPIEINLQNSLATKEFWKKQHSENPDYVNSFKMAWERMEEYEEELKKIFKEESVPEKFIYLSIPESYWNCEKNPGDKAKGVFQITEDTGKRYGMTINNKIDERDNSIKSGRVAAKHLADFHKITGDWNIDLAGYNGSMANDYLKKTSINQNAYKNFLEYTEGQTKEQDIFNYTVSRNDNSIWSIARRFGASTQKIKQQNGIKSDNKIVPGQILKILIPDQEEIRRSKRSYEGFLKYMQNQARVEKAEILSKKYFKYRVIRGDTVDGIVWRFNIDKNKFKRKNNIKKNNKILIGQVLKIPISKEMIDRKYKDAMQKYIENLNYPPKFNAIMELIEDGFVQREENIKIADNVLVE